MLSKPLWSNGAPLATDPDATYDTLVEIDASALSPFVTWGTNPGMVIPVTGRVPDPASLASPTERAAAERALEYMGLQPNTPMQDVFVDNVFIGSCTNSRIEDLRAAAAVVKGRKTHPNVQAMVVPGSTAVKIQAESEGLDRIFKDAGLDWREAGCSMCLGMNPDILQPQQRCASTSNRNFEGRQGPGGRTHLVSPRWQPQPRLQATSWTSANGRWRSVTTATGTSEPGRSGTYRALPLLEDEVMNLILRYAVGPMDILLGDELDTLDALKRIDQELEGLAEANPNLALVLRRTVEAIHAALDKAVVSEQMKVLIRVVAYTNAFTILRTLDMQMRRSQPR